MMAAKEAMGLGIAPKLRKLGTKNLAISILDQGRAFSS